MKILSWNIGRRAEPWRTLLTSDADVALLQEAAQPPREVAEKLQTGPDPWLTEGPGRGRQWRTAVVRLSDRITLDWLKTARLAEAMPPQLGVSRLGTLAAARVTNGDATVTVASLYGLWERPHPTAGSAFIYADGSVHRLISDLSQLVGNTGGRGIIAAGDLNILFGYGEDGNRYWAARYDTVFARLTALGLHFVGPQAPQGRQANPWPRELPTGSSNVPTYYSGRQTPFTATRQLDFVFASADLVERVRVCAMNEPEDWGPSDHCQVMIEIEPLKNNAPAPTTTVT